MAPLIILIVVTLVLALAGAAGVRWLRPWPMAVRGGVAAMFTATGISHFVGMREQLIDMVPLALPAPALLVTVTGVLELAGAVGVLWPRTAPWAAAGLTAMLVLMFPANVYAVQSGVLTAWDDQIVPRTLMQVVFLAATLTVFVHARRGDQARLNRPAHSRS
ncbi:DoxX family protein [Amycolatopsis sp. ATCC 39116]|uniref:DoxX family protein n=1 Tax=Amycolatopsis sp. (strain ATCC 39116 / 75iv2) TaxID=385957 RepID=UPI00026271FA|nr:DoxX family protein [Amycolatopsis sp. ATCC 39116]